jgi:hypothetical protein
MYIELHSGVRVDHPGRDCAHVTVHTDNGDNLLAAAGSVVLPDSDDFPVIWVVPVADRDLFTVL